ncbi:MAG: helix-turn-helix transcriptional regulator [Deltaproteobacteria bacterium]|nr:helix-turn-helix transcriptional regulator [Deltaproteobacteria bacterium]
MFAIDELTRQLLLASVRFGPARDPDDPLANDLLRTLAGLAHEHAARAEPTRLPRPRDPQLARAVAYTLNHLHERIAVSEIARAAGLSERSLHRVARRRLRPQPPPAPPHRAYAPGDGASGDPIVSPWVRQACAPGS